MAKLLHDLTVDETTGKEIQRQNIHEDYGNTDEFKSQSDKAFIAIETLAEFSKNKVKADVEKCRAINEGVNTLQGDNQLNASEEVKDLAKGVANFFNAAEEAKDERLKNILDNISKNVKHKGHEGIDEAAKVLFGILNNCLREITFRNFRDKIFIVIGVAYLLLDRLFKINEPSEESSDSEDGLTHSGIFVSIVTEFLKRVFLFLRDKFFNSAIFQALNKTFQLGLMWWVLSSLSPFNWDETHFTTFRTVGIFYGVIWVLDKKWS